MESVRERAFGTWPRLWRAPHSAVLFRLFPPPYLSLSHTLSFYCDQCIPTTSALQHHTHNVKDLCLDLILFVNAIFRWIQFLCISQDSTVKYFVSSVHTTDFFSILLNIDVNAWCPAPNPVPLVDVLIEYMCVLCYFVSSLNHQTIKSWTALRLF